MTNTCPDLHSAITQNIINQLEAGVRPWQCPWSVRHQAGPVSRPLRGTGQPYQGINVLVLWLTAFERGFSAPIWLTFNQAKELGGFVRKGEKSTTVVYANSIEKTETNDDTGEESKTRIPFLKSYCVFNVDQIEGLPGQFYAREQTSLNTAERVRSAADSSPCPEDLHHLLYFAVGIGKSMSS